MQSSCACEPPRGLRRPTSASPLCEAGSRRSLAWSVAKLAGAWVRSLMADLASLARSVAAVVINACATGRSEWLHRLWPTAAMWRLTCPAGIRAPPRDLFCESLGGVENVGTFDERAALAPKWTAPSCLCNRHVHTHRSLAAGGACGCRFCAVRVAWGWDKWRVPSSFGASICRSRANGPRRRFSIQEAKLLPLDRGDLPRARLAPSVSASPVRACLPWCAERRHGRRLSA